ncbi:amidohydrolase family protein [Singulisphaera sp. Ch08]|uniref:Amidohydrolase family protein n=1 Tax=Singulisphaera sp. Ch08 TaxID=3120278 RepID=A0AAU7C7E2_9BACT
MTPRIIDTNVNLSRWPTRRVRDDETTRLVTTLSGHGVVEAWAGSFDALLHKDLAGVNARLAHECRVQSRIRLVPFGSVNPAQPDWEEDLRRCVEEHGMPGIRLHPNYHGYPLDHPAFAQLLALAAKRDLVVTLCLQMEDERMMHPAFRVAPVNPAPLATVVAKTPGLRLLLLNSLSVIRGQALQKVIQAGDVSVDLSTREGVGGVASLLEEVALERVLFGSHAPCLYFESAILKLKESALAPAQLRAVQEQNARRLIPTAR